MDVLRDRLSGVEGKARVGQGPNEQKGRRGATKARNLQPDPPLGCQLEILPRSLLDDIPNIGDARGIPPPYSRGVKAEFMSLTIPAVKRVGSAEGTEIVKRNSTGEGGKSNEALVRERFGLTATQTKIALSLAEGFSYAEIAERHGISPQTVHTHVKAIHERTGLTSSRRLAALIHALESGKS